MPSESIIDDTASNLATFASYNNNISQVNQNVKFEISYNNTLLIGEVNKNINNLLVKNNDRTLETGNGSHRLLNSKMFNLK